MRSYAPFVYSALADEGEEVQLGYEGTCCLAWGIIFDRRKDRGVIYVFSILNVCASVYGCSCVYTHTRTHTAGYSDVSSGVEMRHLEGPKNPDGLNLGINVFVYVYKVHMCIYMLGGGMRSWTSCFFSLTNLFFRLKKAKGVNAKALIYQICNRLERIDLQRRVLNYFLQE